MKIPEHLHRHLNENETDYINRVCASKTVSNITWTDIAYICNEELGYTFGESYYRKNYKKFLQDSYMNLNEDYSAQPDTFSNASIEGTSDVQSIEEATKALQMERMKLSDERVQNNALLRRLSREDTIKEIALEYAKTMSEKKLLSVPPIKTISNKTERAAILCISDWHYGIEVNNMWNHYGPEIALDRINQLCLETKKLCHEENISDLYVVNLADLIAGRIHAQIRIQSRCDVITQIMNVTEILAEFLTNLSEDVNHIYYYDCLDNHSRIEPNKNESLNLESLARMTPWYLKARLQNNPRVSIGKNEYAQDIIVFQIGDFTIGGVHGDRDKPAAVVNNLTMFVQEKFDLILTAHLHHFSCDEKNNTLVVSNGSLMGTDDYAESLRLNSKPSQNFIVVDKDNVAKEIHRIILD